MKKVFLFLVGLILLTGCSKDKDAVPEMSATIGGTLWKSAIRVTTLESNKFIISGESLDGKSLVITVNGKTEGTYDLNINVLNFEAAYKESLHATVADTYLATSGEVILTDVNTSNHQISGTFNFIMRKNLTDSIGVKNGTFANLYYTSAGGK